MILFVIPLVRGMLVLVPGQTPTALGLEPIVTGVLAGCGLPWINRWPTEENGNRGRVGC
jgi:hypothetical protein